MNLLIKNGTIVQPSSINDRPFKADILIEGSKITKIGKIKESELKKIKIAKKIDAKGKFVIPGFIHTHVHLCQTLFRGTAEDVELLDWLEKFIWPAEASHNEQTIQKSAQIGLKELISSGTTTIVDMGTANYTEKIFEIAKKTGIRAFIGNAMMDFSEKLPLKLRENTHKSINKTLKLVVKWHKSGDGRLNYILSPRFILSCSDDLFKEVKRLSDEFDLLVQTHAAENPKEVNAIKEIKGKNEIHYFEDIGILNEKILMAHCIWLNDEDLGLIKVRNAKVSHCPSANLKLGSGIAKIPEMLNLGINVSIGADGAPCNNNLNMFKEMRLAGLIQKIRKGVTSLPAKKIFDMATINGAKAIRMEKELGSIEENKKADLVILDLNQPNTLPEIDDIYTRIVYSADSNNVETVIVDGKIIHQN